MSTFLPDLEPWQRGLGFAIGAALFAWGVIGAIWHIHRSRTIVATGEPDVPLWHAIQYVAKQIGERRDDGCFPLAVKQIRDAAEAGKVEIWGRKLIGDEFSTQLVPISTDHWIDHAINIGWGGQESWRDHSFRTPVSIPPIRDGYFGLKVRQSEVEKLWGRGPRPRGL